MVFLYKPVTAVHLHRFHGGPHRRFGGKDLGHGGTECVIVIVVFLPGRFQAKQARRFDPGGHIGQFKRDGLVIHDLGTEGLSCFGIFPGQFIGAAGDTQCLRSDPDTTAGQCFHRELKAKAILPDAVRLGYFHVIEHHGMRIAAADTQFIFLGRHHYTGPVLFHDQGIDPA